MNGGMGRHREATAKKSPDDQAARTNALLLHLPAGVGGLFTLMGIADCELAAAKAAAPSLAKLYDAAWGKLFPPPSMAELDSAVYRYHVRELLDWAGMEGPLGHGTKAEVLVVLMHTSFRAPLKRDAQALYETLFEECFGRERALALLGPMRATFSYSGAMAELLHEARGAASKGNGR